MQQRQLHALQQTRAARAEGLARRRRSKRRRFAFAEADQALLDAGASWPVRADSVAGLSAKVLTTSPPSGPASR